MSKDITIDQVEVELNLLKQKLKNNVNSIYLGQMSRDINHDIANVITIMMGKTRIIKGLIEKEPLDKIKAKKLLTDIENNFQRILNIIFFQRVYYIKEQDMVFAYSQGEELAMDLKNLFEDRLTKKGVTLKIENELPANGLFNVNKFLILRSISYLIQNAIESMSLENSEVEYYVKIKIEKSDKNFIVRVIDNGKKITDDVVNAMFNPFFTTKDSSVALGLGLNMLIGLLKKIESHLKFSQTEEMKEFTIEIPLESKS